jgi:hypothetical protein
MISPISNIYRCGEPYAVKIARTVRWERSGNQLDGRIVGNREYLCKPFARGIVCGLKRKRPESKLMFRQRG